MEHSDVVNLLVTVAGTIVVFIGWLWQHSNRLTRSETNIENNARRITDNANRTADDFRDIKGALVRIEDLVSRQHSQHREGN